MLSVFWSQNDNTVLGAPYILLVESYPRSDWLLFLDTDIILFLETDITLYLDIDFDWTLCLATDVIL